MRGEPSYAAQYGLNSGDTLSMPFYVTRYNDDGFSLRYEHSACRA